LESVKLGSNGSSESRRAVSRPAILTGRHPRLMSKMAQGRRHGWPLPVVQDDQPAGSNEGSQKVQIDEHLVITMASVHEFRIGSEFFACEAWERDGGRLG
jgi:hypothetical protein